MPEKLVDQPSARPTRKNERGGLSASVAVLVIAALHQGMGWDISPDVAAAITAVVAFGVSYIVRDREQ